MRRDRYEARWTQHKLDITMEQVAHAGYSTPSWEAMPHSNLPTCALLLFWHRPAWRQLAEEKQAYRWPPGLPSSPPLSSRHLPPDRSAPEVVCKDFFEKISIDPNYVSHSDWYLRVGDNFVVSWLVLLPYKGWFVWVFLGMTIKTVFYRMAIICVGVR